MAYQLAFHLEQTAGQSLLQHVVDHFTQVADTSSSSSSSSAAAAAAASASTEEGEEKEKQQEGADAVQGGLPAKELTRLKEILTGNVSRPLYVEFMTRNNKTDPQILAATKKAVGGAASVLDNAILLSHAIMSAGTTSDKFLRDNQEFLSHFINWSKFSVVASLGVIHKGHASAAQDVLEPYLPTESNSNEYENGGALYALGKKQGGGEGGREKEGGKRVQFSTRTSNHRHSLTHSLTHTHTYTPLFCSQSISHGAAISRPQDCQGVPGQRDSPLAMERAAVRPVAAAIANRSRFSSPALWLCLDAQVEG